jgi:Fic family protein
MMWNSMRDEVVNIMPASPGMRGDIQEALKSIQERYREDAYHSLSIEGYQVTEELIEKIESGEWDPENVAADKRQKDMLAAKGYQAAFKAVLQSISRVLDGDKAGKVFEEDLQTWYRQLFAPLLKANILSAENLVGYRNQPVYISGSRHVPPPRNAVPDCMETLFDLLKMEQNAAVRAVLGHFIFVFIHPYMDGNGRVGRFLMNLMLVSGGFSWAVIKSEKRDEYMTSLEKASTEEEIKPFVEFIKKYLFRPTLNEDLPRRAGADQGL